jgi:hydroxymethylbilane synthase
MRLGTRASALALAQTESVLRALGGGEIVHVTTSGDSGAAGDKSRWVDGIERALLAGEIDLAVHSAKDVPGRLAPGLALLASMPRAASADVLCGCDSLDALPGGARVGTASLRRAAQLRAARADLKVVELRGNVPTRLAALDDAERRLDAIVLARAGLDRLGLSEHVGGELDERRFVPAPGQGVIAIEGRADDPRALAAARQIGDARALVELHAERALADALDADCSTPLGARARADGDVLTLTAWVGAADGSAWLLDEQSGAAAQPQELGGTVAQRLLAAGARELLAGSAA